MAKSTKMSIDHVVGQLAPWDLRLQIDGEWYQTKELSLGAIELLNNAAAGEAVDFGGLLAVVEDMFHIKPNVRAWSVPQLMTVVQTVVSYLTQRQKKMAPRVGELVGKHSLAALVEKEAAESTETQPTPTPAVSSQS